MPSAPIIYIRDAFALLDVEDVRQAIRWEDRTPTRSESFMAQEPVSYTYGKGAGARTYESVPYPKLIEDIQLIIQRRFLHARFGMCFANLYKFERDHLGWHADDSPIIDHTVGIVVVSFGAEREIWFRENGKTEFERLKLQHGSLLYMRPGMQSTHQHRIPKHGAACGPRVSLTFRAPKVRA